MSTIKVENIRIASEAVSRPVTGVAAAWVNFNGTGTVAIRDSLNVGSLTDNAAGDYSVNFSNSFASANHAGSGFAGEDKIIASYRNQMAQETVSKAGIATANSVSMVDQSLVTFINHGELA